MKRLRVRREVLVVVTVLELMLDAPSSSEEKLVDEDVRERDS